MDHRRCPLGLPLLLGLGPQFMEIGQVADDICVRPVAGRRADDHTARHPVLGAELTDDPPQPDPVFAGHDLARHTDVVHRRHEDEEAARYRHMGRDASALRAERLLDHLHDDLLTGVQEFFDFLLAGVAIPAAATPAPTAGPSCGPRPGAPGGLSVGLAVGVGGVDTVQGVHGVNDIADVEEPVALETEIDEGALHPWQHLLHAPLIDVAGDAARLIAFDRDLDDFVVLENCGHGLVTARGDDHLLVHR